MGDYIFVRNIKEISQSGKLILEYAESLGCSPCLDNIGKEMKSFPEPFAPPAGCLILAVDNNNPAGIVGLKKIEESISEMARLYVRPDFRGQGYGKGLTLRCMAAAEELGYRAIRLYTLPAMTTAVAMYRKIGFAEIAPYTAHPIEEALYMEYRFRTDRD